MILPKSFTYDIGLIHMELGHYEEAEAYLQESLESSLTPFGLGPSHLRLY
jgi:hypothetical protein